LRLITRFGYHLFSRCDVGLFETVNLILGIGFNAIGLALVFWATPLSVRYNAWTGGLRERHPNVYRQPTPKWREQNTKIMTVIFRVFGLFLVLLSIKHFLPLIASKLN
jgi:hypothetical protein